jgi:ATP synthase protein I
VANRDQPGSAQSRLDSLSQRLDKAKGEDQARKRAREGSRGMGPGLSMGVELVAAVLVGAAVGWALDRLFNSGPWLLIVFFLLGMVAGLRNAMRKAEQMSQAAKAAATNDEKP